MVTAEKLRIFVSTGEVSGDVVGALLARRVLAERPDTVLFGVGGARMREAGVEVDFPTNHLGAVGITEAIAKLPSFLRAVGAIRRRVLSDRPDAAVLIGNDVFNVLLGRWLRWKGIATVSYFPPQVWIWGALGRWIARSFDLILTSFPEEERVYSRGEARTAFVGHYLCDVLRPVTPEERIEARGRLGVDAQGTVVGLLPGSRSQEVDKLAPVFLDAVRGLLDRKKEGLTFLLPVAEPLYAERIAAAHIHKQPDAEGRIFFIGKKMAESVLKPTCEFLRPVALLACFPGGPQFIGIQVNGTGKIFHRQVIQLPHAADLCLEVGTRAAAHVTGYAIHPRMGGMLSGDKLGIHREVTRFTAKLH